MDETIIAQMGLMLTQLRFARRALEDLERNTATYGGFAFLKSLTPEARFGAPPLLDGALKVYVVNINDLTASSGFGGFVEGLLGGVGRLFGGFLGGLVGGTIGGAALPALVWRLSRVAEQVAEAARVLGVVKQSDAQQALAELQKKQAEEEKKAKTPAEATAVAAPAAVAAPDPGPAAANVQAAQKAAEEAKKKEEASGGMMSKLPELTDVLLGLAALFRAAGSGPGTGSGKGPTADQKAAMDQFTRWVEPVLALMRSLERVVDGLVILVPLLVGAFAFLLSRVDTLKLLLVDMLQFLLRNVLLLRGVVLVTVFDTVSAAARLGANVLRILAVAVNTILESVFTLIAQVLKTALAAVRLVVQGVVDTVNVLIPWLVSTVAAVLTTLGNLRVFGLIQHVVEVLPAILPALVRLVHNVSLDPAEMALVKSVASRRVPRGHAGPPPVFPKPPDIASTLLPGTRIGDMVDKVVELGKGVRATTDTALGASAKALDKMGGMLDEKAFRGKIDAQLKDVETHSATLAGSLDAARKAAAARPETGLGEIANAYQAWLSGGGLDTLLTRINQHFAATPAEQAAIPGKIAADVALERARATVEIGEMVIEIEPPAGAAVPTATLDLPGGAGGPGGAPKLSAIKLAKMVDEESRELQDRGARFGMEGFALEV